MNTPEDEAAAEPTSTVGPIVPGETQAFHSVPRGGFRALRIRIRALARLAVFALATIGLSAWFFLVAPATLGSPARRTRLRNAVFRRWAVVSLAAVGVRVTVRGCPPAGPCFLLSNHIVYVDIWLLASQTSAVFVAESGIARWPFFGFMARVLDIIFVDRLNNRTLPVVNARMEEAFARGHVVAIFPEGRTGPGTVVLPFRTSLLEPPARHGHPIAWATIGYTTGPDDPPPSQSVRWPDGMSVAKHAAKFLLLDRIDATVTFGEGTVRGSNRKALAEDLHRRVASSFEPLA